MTMTTCAEKFEHRGNPWLTEREREEMRARLIPARGGRKVAKPREPWVDVKPTRPPESEKARKLRIQREVLREAIRLMDCPARRYIAPEPVRKPAPDRVIAPKPEPNEWDPAVIAERVERAKRNYDRMIAEALERRGPDAEDPAMLAG